MKELVQDMVELDLYARLEKTVSVKNPSIVFIQVAYTYVSIHFPSVILIIVGHW